jgi:hypothetical protein
MANAVPSMPVPPVLRTKLRSVQNRRTKVSVLAGSMNTAAGVLIVMMIAMVIDWQVTLFNLIFR